MRDGPRDNRSGGVIHDPDRLEPVGFVLWISLEPHAKPAHDVDRPGVVMLGRRDDAA